MNINYCKKLDLCTRDFPGNFMVKKVCLYSTFYGTSDFALFDVCHVFWWYRCSTVRHFGPKVQSG